MESPLWTFIYSLQNSWGTRPFSFLPALKFYENARYLDTIKELPNGVHDEVQKYRTLGHIQTIELKGFGCYIPLHFPKDISILKLSMQPKDGQRGRLTGPDAVGYMSYAEKCAS